MNDNTLLVSQLLISKLPPRPTQHILHVKPWWELSKEAWFQLYLTINHLTGSQEPWVVSSLFILSNLFLTNDRFGLLRKTDMPYNKSDLKQSDYLLKAVQATSSSFRKLNPNQNFTGQSQEELVMVFSSLISTSCVYICITGVYWDVGIIAWWALESDRFGTKFLSLIIRETQSMQFNVYTTHQKR